jgi:hypothetical protein
MLTGLVYVKWIESCDNLSGRQQVIMNTMKDIGEMEKKEVLRRVQNWKG